MKKEDYMRLPKERHTELLAYTKWLDKRGFFKEDLQCDFLHQIETFLEMKGGENGNEEKARELAIISSKYIDDDGKEMYNVCVEAALQEMAQWKDQQFSIERKQLIEKANQAVTQSFENGAIFKKQEMIEKACRFLENNLSDFWQCKIYDEIDFIKQFKQAMEE
ncbi:MAG: hypothetical protein II684_05205 [Treponema sp.]|nr:hypothetical protein [Alphaproteobacteria bacterium]MBQ3966208.1 hypothetical protein [Treponema sp.]